MSDPSQHPSNRVIVIGAGPAGLTAAYQLARQGVESLVLEKDRVVGGISRTVRYKDHYFDIGGHRFFTKIESVDKMWREVLGEDLLRRSRLSRIYFNKKFFYYPLRPLNALFGLGLYNSLMILLSYVYSQLFPYGREETFEQWVSNRFGKRLFQTFFKTYSEKVWGMSCSEIRAEWAAQRIKGLSLLSALRNALVGQNGADKKNVIKTLIDEFDYPKLGPGMMWQEVANRIERNGSQVWLGAEVDGIVWSENRVEALEIRRNEKTATVRGTDFISSMPLQEAILKFKPAVPEEVRKAAISLNYRDFLTVAVIVNKRRLFPDNWIYVHDPGVKVGRIQNFKNWSPFMVPDENKTCLGLEYFCFEGDDLWNRPDEQLIRMAAEELEALQLVDSSDVEDGHVVRMPKAYPVYDSNYLESLQVIREFLNGIGNFQMVGRNGMHKYNNMDHSMLTAMLAVENVLGATHDVWKVNDESDYHEEAAVESEQQRLLNARLQNVFARMDKFAFATATGFVCGFLLFLTTLFVNLKGDTALHPYMALLGQYFYGYSMSIAGAFWGFASCFAWAFLLGWLFAYLRNLLLGFLIYRIKRKVEVLTFRDFLDHF